jgi:hypothetical protein
MKLKNNMIVIGCMASIIIVMSALYAFSPLSKDVEPSSFTRKFADSPSLTFLSSYQLDPKGQYYIAGFANNKIYLGNHTKPFSVIELDTLLKTSKIHIIRLSKVDSIKQISRFKVTIDSPYFFFANGSMPIILKGELDAWTAFPFIDYKGYYFEDAVSITPSTFALRSYSNQKESVHLGLLDAIDTPHFAFRFDLLEKQREGLFSTQGNMHYDKSSKKFVFLYSYRNKYIITDSLLNKQSINNTIDTFNTAPIRIRKVNQGNTYMLSSPPLIINGQSCVSEKRLYIKSNLMGKSEDKKKFLTSSTIDVYDIEKGTYLTSFYIPGYQGKELVDYYVHRGNAYIIYEDHITAYNLDI